MPTKFPELSQRKQNRIKLLGVFFVFLIPFEINGFYNPHIQHNPILFWLIDICIFIVSPALLLWLAISKRWLNPEDIKLHLPKKNNLRVWFVIYCILLCPALYLLYYYSYLFAQQLIPVNYGVSHFSYNAVIPEQKYLAILAGLHLSLTAGIVEEIYYRGIFRQFFDEGKLQAFLYISISSVVFASPHWEGGIHNLFASFIIGLATASSFWCYRYLLPLIIAHCFVDSMFYLF